MAGLITPIRTSISVSPSDNLLDDRKNSVSASKASGWAELTTVPPVTRIHAHSSSTHLSNRGKAGSLVSVASFETKGQSMGSKLEKVVNMAALRAAAAGVVLTLATCPCSLAEVSKIVLELPDSRTEQVRAIDTSNTAVSRVRLADLEDFNWGTTDVVSERYAGFGLGGEEAGLRGEGEKHGRAPSLLYRGAGAERGAQTALLLPVEEDDEDDDFGFDEVGAAGVGFCRAWQVSSLELIMPDSPRETPLPPGDLWSASFSTSSAPSLSVNAPHKGKAPLLKTSVKGKSPLLKTSAISSARRKVEGSVPSPLTPANTLRVGMSEEDPVWEVLIGGCFTL